MASLNECLRGRSVDGVAEAGRFPPRRGSCYVVCGGGAESSGPPSAQRRQPTMSDRALVSPGAARGPASEEVALERAAARDASRGELNFGLGFRVATLPTASTQKSAAARHHAQALARGDRHRDRRDRLPQALAAGPLEALRGRHRPGRLGRDRQFHAAGAARAARGRDALGALRRAPAGAPRPPRAADVHRRREPVRRRPRVLRRAARGVRGVRRRAQVGAVQRLAVV